MKWQIGNSQGYNANLIYDEKDDAILEVFGVPLHTKVKDVPEGKLWLSRQIVAEHNAHEELVALAREVRDHLYIKQDVSRVHDMARAVLKKLGDK